MVGRMVERRMTVEGEEAQMEIEMRQRQGLAAKRSLGSGSDRGSRRKGMPGAGLCLLAALAALAGRCTCTGPEAGTNENLCPGPACPECIGDDCAPWYRDAERPWPRYPDGGAPPDYHPGPFPDAEPCDATLVELPEGEGMLAGRASMDGSWIVYDRNTSGLLWPDGPDIYLYDLDTCTEQAITADPYVAQLRPVIWRGRMAYVEQVGTWSYSITTYDIAQNQFAGIASMQDVDLDLLGYAQGVLAVLAGYASEPEELLLRLSTEAAVRMPPGDQSSAHPGDLSSEVYTWYVDDDVGEGIWVYRMSTQRRGWVGNPPGLNKNPTAGGGWVVWQGEGEAWRHLWAVRWADSLDGSAEPALLYPTSAKDTDPRLRGHLLCFRTTLWSGGVSAGWDVAVRDMDTGVLRRVTRFPSASYRCERPDGDWLLYREQQPPFHQDTWKIYAFNLRRNGLLGPDGHLVPE